LLTPETFDAPGHLAASVALAMHTRLYRCLATQTGVDAKLEVIGAA